MAKRPPSSCTIGRRSGGSTGSTVRTIHCGLLPDLRSASTTRRRLVAFLRCWPRGRLDLELQLRAQLVEVDAVAGSSSSASAPMPALNDAGGSFSSSSRRLCSGQERAAGRQRIGSFRSSSSSMLLVELRADRPCAPRRPSCAAAPSRPSRAALARQLSLSRLPRPPCAWTALLTPASWLSSATCAAAS